MRFVFIFCVLLTFQNVFPETGIPLITNYSPKDYNAHGQNWQVIKGPQGIFYFANTDGVLSYNGVNWNLISLPNYVIARSLAVDSLNIFVGAQDEIGVIKADNQEIMQYNSLTSLLPDGVENFGDVWYTFVSQQNVYWLTRKHLIVFNKKTQTFQQMHSAQTYFHTMHKVGERLFIHQPGHGLSEFVKSSLIPISGCEDLINMRIYSILEWDEKSILIGTRTNGMFLFDGEKCLPFKTEADGWMKESQFYHATYLADKSIALATLNHGIIIVDRQGKILMHVDNEKGLQDNKVWHIFADDENNLWLALNKGITKIYWPAPITFFSEQNGLLGNVQSIARHKETLYVATGAGVFYLAENRLHPQFIKVNNFETQCWHLLNLDNRLLVASNIGIFEIKNKQVIRLAPYSTWKMLRWKNNPDILFLGLDDGLAALRINQQEFEDLGRLPRINVETRTLAQDSIGNVWIGTARQGVIRVQVKDLLKADIDVKLFSESNGLPGLNFNLVYQAGEKAFITTGAGIYAFNPLYKRLEPVEKYNTFLPKKRSGAAFYTLAMDKNDIWINNGLKPLLFKETTGHVKAHRQPFLVFPERLIYTIFPENNSVWFGGPEGIVRYDKNIKVNPQKPFDTNINRFISINDSLQMGAFIKENPVLKYVNNALRISYGSNSFVNEAATLYQSQLEGFENNWTSWKNETQRDFTNLFEGSYLFKVRAKNIYGVFSAPAIFAFKIQAPWYRTYWAYSIYFVFLAVLVFQTIRYQKIRRRNKELLETQKYERLRKKTEEDLRQQMAADFHDELGNKITRISLFTELIKQNKKLPKEVMNHVSKISDNANSLYTETRDFIWQLDPQKDSLFDFITRIKKFADELFDESTVHFELNNTVSNAELLKLTMEWRRHLIRIFKEALHNAFKHAACKNIVFKISAKDSKLVFELSDDGVGFDLSQKSQGNGLFNMQKRAAKINAEFVMNSELNKGTYLKLIIKKAVIQ